MFYCARLLAVTVVLCLFGSWAKAQSYRVYRPLPHFPYSANNVERNNLLQLELTPLVSFGPIKDYTGTLLTPGMAGLRIGSAITVTERLSVGVEGGISRSFGGDISLLASMTRRSISGVFRWTVTENTIPKIYVLGAVGAVCYNSRLKVSRYDFKQCGSVFAVGMGNELALSSHLYLQAQYRLMYEPDPWETFLFSAPKWSNELSGGIQWRF